MPDESDYRTSAFGRDSACPVYAFIVQVDYFRVLRDSAKNRPWKYCPRVLVHSARIPNAGYISDGL
jgi:hypothetical protein